MPDDLKPFRILFGDDGHRGVTLHQATGVHQLSIDLAGNCGLGKSRTDTRRDVGNFHGLRICAHRAVRERDVDHKSLYQ